MYLSKVIYQNRACIVIWINKIRIWVILWSTFSNLTRQKPLFMNKDPTNLASKNGNTQKYLNWIEFAQSSLSSQQCVPSLATLINIWLLADYSLLKFTPSHSTLTQDRSQSRRIEQKWIKRGGTSVLLLSMGTSMLLEAKLITIKFCKNVKE